MTDKPVKIIMGFESRRHSKKPAPDQQRGVKAGVSCSKSCNGRILQRSNGSIINV
jgi:hypothetical protein